ncbi:hypothetical protein INT80_08205 [Gallibacterium anatis]|uniref:Uncharacterized protein n=1 Tax=Gallibacterium anatis TaxID=750 RepID=A0A930Y3W6_9PAST|nr:hypothetical protein [Gallibacterium anatis]
MAEGNIAYQAKNIDASTTSVLAAGVRFTPTATTEEKRLIHIMIKDKLSTLLPNNIPLHMDKILPLIISILKRQRLIYPKAKPVQIV